MVYVTEIIPINTDREGNCLCLKAGYYKMGMANFVRHPNDGLKATCVMELQESQILTPRRTDFGKQIRKDYESGKVDISRHDMTTLEPRTDGLSNTITTVQKDNLVAEVQQVGNIVDDTNRNFKNPQTGRVYSAEGLSPTINTCQGGGNEPKIVEYLCSVHPLSHAKEFDPNTSIKPISPALRATDYKAPHCVYEPLHIREATAKGYAEAYDGDSVNLAVPSSQTRRGRVGNQIANTLDTGCQQGVVTRYRIRKLTPRECFRLMDVSETDIDKLLSAGISNSQLYKLAGNSICVGVLFHIMRKMFCETQNEHQQLTLF